MTGHVQNEHWQGTPMLYFTKPSYGPVYIRDEGANNLPSTEQATKTQPKQDQFLSHFSPFFTVYLFKCRFVA